MKKVWIDAGHGGSDSGAVIPGRLEKDDNLAYAGLPLRSSQIPQTAAEAARLRKLVSAAKRQLEELADQMI